MLLRLNLLKRALCTLITETQYKEYKPVQIQINELFRIAINNCNSCENASERGHLEVLIYLHENGCFWNENCCVNASSNGGLECLKYLHENGCPWNENCCENASWKVHLDVLNYLHKNGCPWNKIVVNMHLIKDI